LNIGNVRIDNFQPEDTAVAHAIRELSNRRQG
jgi:hypothetical protein